MGIFRLGGGDDSFWETLKKVTTTPGATANLLPQEAAPPSTALKTIDLFTDDMGNTGAYVYPGIGSSEAHHGGGQFIVVYKNGKRWWDLQIEGDGYSGGGIYFPVHDLKPYLATGALQFYIRGMQGGESFSVGFSGPKWIKDRKTEWNFTTENPVTD